MFKKITTENIDHDLVDEIHNIDLNNQIVLLSPSKFDYFNQLSNGEITIKNDEARNISSHNDGYNIKDVKILKKRPKFKIFSPFGIIPKIEVPDNQLFIDDIKIKYSLLDGYEIQDLIKLENIHLIVEPITIPDYNIYTEFELNVKFDLTIGRVDNPSQTISENHIIGKLNFLNNFTTNGIIYIRDDFLYNSNFGCEKLVPIGQYG